MALKDLADEYFSNLNSMANRIYTDLNEIKGSYENLWDSLTEDEKNQILTESIIKPEVCVKYNKPQVTSKKKNDYATKLVVDDNCSYRDEYSAPFSFRTPSQRNLKIFNVAVKDTSKVSLETKSKEPKLPLLVQIKTEDGIPEISSYKTSVLNIPKTGLELLDNW